MADADAVLEEAIEELHRLAVSGGKLEELQRLARLAHAAYHARGGGEVPDDEVREGGLHVSQLRRLGL